MSDQKKPQSKSNHLERLVMPDFCNSLSGCCGGDYCKKCSHSLYFGEVFVNGRKWTFEFNPQFGSLFTNLDGTIKKIQPREKHPVWDAFQKWHDDKFSVEL